MGSDGAMEAGEGALEDALAAAWALEPDRLSEALLRAAEEAGGGRRDDMTVLCLTAARARSPVPSTKSSFSTWASTSGGSLAAPRFESVLVKARSPKKP